MREIKAIVRRERVPDVIGALHALRLLGASASSRPVPSQPGYVGGLGTEDAPP